HSAQPQPDAAAGSFPGQSQQYAHAAAYGAYAQRQPRPAATPPAAPADPNGHATAGLVGRTVAEVERELILDTLEHTLGNRTHAANILGISIRTLRNKLRAYMDEGVQVPAPSASDRAHA
ncbi:helix-turn-helix domain-containing protein, partial [Rhodovibrio sodomensis]|uniref:helix-turn-helix domain-containing protein n=1 Tax=Rhodovibrio sodomensis TaxID=1088 RepID=UPI00190397B5